MDVPEEDFQNYFLSNALQIEIDEYEENDTEVEMDMEFAIFLKVIKDIEEYMADEKRQGFFRRHWIEIVYVSIIFSVFFGLTFEIAYLQTNHLTINNTANLFNNINFLTYFTLLFFIPFSEDSNGIRQIRRSRPFVISIFIVGIVLLYVNYNFVIDKTITDLEYLDRSTIIIAVCFLGYSLVYGLFQFQDWRRRASIRKAIIKMPMF